MEDQSRASAPISTSRSISREGLATASRHDNWISYVAAKTGVYTWSLAADGKLTATDELVVKTHIECGVSSRSESLAHLANNILRTTVVIAHRILDLYRAGPVSHRVPHVTTSPTPPNITTLTPITSQRV